tara:strand:- start:125 stop:415 length:291 start_codon:yes stop_codon:yes gene_type:complete
MSKTPLTSRSIDCGVFCLSLMGTNFVDFLKEANLVLKYGGKLFVAEVLSRFENIKEFTDRYMRDAGFELLKISKLEDFFYVMVFKKVKDFGDIRHI